MSASSIGAGKAAGYARYLEGKTVAPERGDYYLTPDGQLTEAPGRWLSDRETLERLGIDPDAPLDGRQFTALMQGRHPGTGRWLRPAGADGSRGGGIDVTFSAPKSVSVVWALGDPWQREQIEAAHTRAVERTVDYLRERVPVVRRRYEGQVVEKHAKDVMATAYQHTTARGVAGGDAPDPQLHTHVVITGAVRDDDRFVAVASRPIFRAGRELGAFYRSALAQELLAEGYEVQQGAGTGRRYFELAGVPRALCEEFSARRREIVRAAERFRAKHGRAPERGELRDLALENRRSKELATRGDLQRAWAHTAERHGFGPDDAIRLVGAPDPPEQERAVEDRIEGKLTEREALFDQSTLRAVALEQTPGELAPEQALEVARAMVAERRVLSLEGGRMTTLEVRAREQAIERSAASLARPADRDVGDVARELASIEVAERIGAPLSVEQESALRAITRPERLGVLVGPAGTGKGVVIDAAARAEQTAGRELVGVAVSGSTAERLGQDSPALAERTMTLDALTARAERGTVNLGPDTTVILDEAGMVDHKRIDSLTQLIDRSGAKLVAVGDGRQLPSIGPGGMFDRLAGKAPAAELQGVHRTSDPRERKAWAALRAGEPERAMAHYRSQGRLHFADTREQAGEHAVQDWAKLTKDRDPREVALIADASNVEIDRLNARAQHLRAQRGELGDKEVQLPNRHYGLRQGDLVTFTAQHRSPGAPKIENGARGQVTYIHGWLERLEEDLLNAVETDGIDRAVVSLSESFGEPIRKAAAAIAEGYRTERERGALRFSTATGALSLAGELPVRRHGFYGEG
jgi:conjugative relaxase-like TrwC/TraI family protein